VSTGGSRPDATALGLELLARLTVTLDPDLLVGTVPDGTRRVIPITGGSVDGPLLRGEVLPGGADWNIARDDGTGSLSARYALRTHDGVLIGVLNEGRYDARRPAPIMTTPVLEAPAGPYDWLNSAALIGTLIPGGPPGSVDLEFWWVRTAEQEATVAR
jgi:hypothetical protein